MAVQEWLQKRAQFNIILKLSATMRQTYQLAQIMLKKNYIG